MPGIVVLFSCKEKQAHLTDIVVFKCYLQIRGTNEEKTPNVPTDEKEESKDLETDYKKRLSFRCSGLSFYNHYFDQYI